MQSKSEEAQGPGGSPAAARSWHSWHHLQLERHSQDLALPTLPLLPPHRVAAQAAHELRLVFAVDLPLLQRTYQHRAAQQAPLALRPGVVPRALALPLPLPLPQHRTAATAAPVGATPCLSGQRRPWHSSPQCPEPVLASLCKLSKQCHASKQHKSYVAMSEGSAGL